MSSIRQCPLCFENYDTIHRIPRILPKCLHSMCSVCLPQLYKSPAFVECPTCREVNAVRVEQVPKNRDILEFLEYFKSQQQQQPSANETTSTTSSSNITSIPTTTTTTTERPPLNETPISSNYQHSSPDWNEGKYLRILFDEIDHNKDGNINFDELYEALRKGQPNSKFDRQTVEVLLEKYDSDYDNEISFDEFVNLFGMINHQYGEFLEIDSDCSGSIEPNELRTLFAKRHITFSSSFYQFLFNGIFARTYTTRITFDIYVRLIARLDKLQADYRASTDPGRRRHDEHGFEDSVRMNIFKQF